MKKKHLTTAMAIIGMALIAPAAQADLLVFEGFNYSEGSLAEQNGGLGFASGWVDSTGTNTGGYVWEAAPNVTFDGKTLDWDGVLNNGYRTTPATGIRFMGATAVASSGVDVRRTLSSSAGSLAGGDGVVWMSAVYHLPNRLFGAGLHIGLASGRMFERSRQFETETTQFIGVSPYRGSSNQWDSNRLVPAVVASNTGANAWGDFARTVSAETLPAGDMILVMKFTFGASDTVEAFVFSEDDNLVDITEAAFELGKTSTTYAAGIDETTLTEIVINQGRFDNVQDEIRIGDTFADVTKLPAPGPVDIAASEVVSSPPFVNADGSSPSTITVILTDSLGVPVPSKDVALANTAGPQMAIIDPLTAVTTDANGQAAFTVTSSSSGIEEFTATNTTDAQIIAQTASVTFIGAADADLSTVEASPSYVNADGTTASTITVTLKAAGDVLVNGKEVSLANTAGPQAAVISPAGSQVTDVNGQVIFNVRSSTPGTEVFTATDVTDGNLVIIQTASVAFAGQADPGTSTVEASPGTVVADGSLVSTITVLLKDAAGFPVEGEDVTLANSSGPQAAVIDPLTALTTDVNGEVSFTVSSSTPGTEEFTATAVNAAVTVTQVATVEFLDTVTPLAFNVSFVQFTPGPGDFEDPATLEGPAGGAGETWNQFRAASGTNLLASGGVATPVGVTTTYSEGRQRSATGLTLLNDALTDFAKGLTRTATISGLVPGSLYNVWLASTATNGAASERSNGTFSLSNSTSTVGGQVIDQSSSANTTTWEQGNNYVLFENVVVDGGGNINLTAVSTEGFRLTLSGFQLVPVGKGRIVSFEAAGNPGVIDQDAFTINVTVPAGTNLSTLAPTFRLNSGTSDQTSGAPPSPPFAAANPVDYVVTDTSTDPDTVNTYSVTVTEAPAVGTLVIDLGAGIKIEGGSFGTFGATNLPLPALPPGSILRSIAVDTVFESTDNNNFASDLAVLIDPTPGTPGSDFSLLIGNGDLDFGATLKVAWPTSADVSPISPLIDSKDESVWSSLGAIDLSTNGLFLGNVYQDGGFQAGDGGTWSGTITLTYDLVGAGTNYTIWSGGALFSDDKNGDKVSNGLAFLLGADNPDVDARGLLPTVTESAGGLVLTFTALDAASRGPSVLEVQSSNDLGLSDQWDSATNSATVPEPPGATVNDVVFVVTEDASDPNLNDVVATIPVSKAADGKLFGRLSGSEN